MWTTTSRCALEQLTTKGAFCIMGKANTIFPGQRFGRMTVVYELVERVHQKRAYLCQCECGEATVKTSAALFKGIVSCGCYARENASIAHKTHGYSNDRKSRVYRIWINMRVRCSKPNAPDYARYGGRGIQVCARWQSFENFLADMGLPPSAIHTLDRKNVNGNYELDNCKWSTQTEQQRNRRNNVVLSYGGLTLILTEWAEATGIQAGTIGRRINKYGYTVGKALGYPEIIKHPKTRQIVKLPIPEGFGR